MSSTQRGSEPAVLVTSAGIRRVEELDWLQASGGAPFPITLTPARHLLCAHAVLIAIARYGAASWWSWAARRSSSPGIRRMRRCSPKVGQWPGPIDRALLPIGAYEPR